MGSSATSTALGRWTPFFFLARDLEESPSRFLIETLLSLVELGRGLA